MCGAHSRGQILFPYKPMSTTQPHLCFRSQQTQTGEDSTADSEVARGGIQGPGATQTGMDCDLGQAGAPAAGYLPHNHCQGEQCPDYVYPIYCKAIKQLKIFVKPQWMSSSLRGDIILLQNINNNNNFRKKNKKPLVSEKAWFFFSENFTGKKKCSVSQWVMSQTALKRTQLRRMENPPLSLLPGMLLLNQCPSPQHAPLPPVGVHSQGRRQEPMKGIRHMTALSVRLPNVTSQAYRGWGAGTWVLWDLCFQTVESCPRRQPSPRNKGIQLSRTVLGRSSAVWRPHCLLTVKIQKNVFLPFPGNWRDLMD